MNFKLDENLGLRTRQLFLDAGHEFGKRVQPPWAALTLCGVRLRHTVPQAAAGEGSFALLLVRKSAYPPGSLKESALCFSSSLAGPVACSSRHEACPDD